MEEALSHQIRTAFEADDHALVGQLLADHKSARELLDRPLGSWGQPPLALVRSREMVDCLLDAGADVNVVSQWWDPGFGVREVHPDVASYLIERGASVSPHAAAGLGLVDELREQLENDPTIVDAKGGDGCRPLHFARNAGIANLLIERGADLDARDDDHASTPMQWLIKDAPDVVRLLLSKGAAPDIFLAAGLGDANLARQLIREDAACTSYRIGNNEGPFPGIGFEGRGGTIYQWTLGFNQSPHEIAIKRGHQQVYDELWASTTPRFQLLVAASLADRPRAEKIVREHPAIIDEMDDEDRMLPAKFCWETNKNLDAVRLMLDVGLPVDHPEINHGYSALHNAAWCGDVELVALLLERGHSPDLRDPAHNATPIGYAVHSCIEAKRHPTGKFAAVVELLLSAGAPFEEANYPVGDASIDAVVAKHLGK